MDISFLDLLNIVPGLVYAVLVVLIYRDGAKQIEQREERLTRHHQEELDRLNAVHNARVEALQTLLETCLGGELILDKKIQK